MILTCPACGTQYVVKDGAIPASGRQVRCAACGHSWRQQPEEADAEPAPAEEGGETVVEADEAGTESSPAAEDRREAQPDAIESQAPPAAYIPEEPQVTRAEPLAEPPMPPPVLPQEEDAGFGVAHDPAETDDSFSGGDEPFAFFSEQPAPRRRSGLALLVLGLLLIAAAAVAFWIFAPAEWRERLGVASASRTSLQLMMTHSDRQPLASGNELLAVSGRVINPTDEVQDVPPIRAELRNGSGKLVYSWTIPPPARSLPPGGSASFNSAELDVPAGGEELTVTLGQPRA